MLNLKPCSQCHKEIPAGITECPYCHRREQGLEGNTTEQATLNSLEAQLQGELAQLEHDDPFVRQSAADRILQRGAAGVPLLNKVLNEHTRKGLPEVARLLGRLRDRRAIGALTQALKIGDEDLRIAAVWALTQFNEAQVLDELLNEIDRPNPMIQSYLAHTLVNYQDPRIVPSLIKLTDHKSPDVAFQAVWALGEAGDKTAIVALRKVLGRRDALLRAAAAFSLRRLGGPVRRAYSWQVYAAVIGGLSVVSAILWHFYR
jgi:HEAT repeat protein